MSRHVAGPGISDALPICRWADARGIRTNIEPWPFANESANSMKRNYITAARSVGPQIRDCTLGLKLPAIGYDQGLFAEVADAAQAAGVKIYFGSLDHESAGEYFSFLERVVAQGHRPGCTLPSRWMRSLDDVQRVVDLGLNVRVVKGQWVDPDSPRLDDRKNFLEIVSRLAGRSRLVGVATHDVPLAETALGRLSKSNTEFEVEQFFSLPLNCMDLAKRFKCNYRIHVTYGGEGIPYNTRFAFRRPQIFFLMAGDLVGRRRYPWAGEPPDSVV